MYTNLTIHQILDYFPEPIIIVNTLGMIRFSNNAFNTMLGYQASHVHNENILHFLQDDTLFDSCLLELENSGTCSDKETYFKHYNGSFIPTIKSINMIPIEGEVCLFVNIRNISAIEKLNQSLSSSNAIAASQAQHLSAQIDTKTQELEASQSRLNEILSTINEIVWYIDNKTFKVHYVSDAVENIFGVDKQDFIDDPMLWQMMVHKEDQKNVQELFTHLKSSQTESIEFRIRRKDGSIRWLNNRITLHPTQNIFIGVTFDITDNKTTQDRIEFLAYHDVLTNLPNRAYLKKEIELMLERSKVISQTMAVLFLDLDNFKYINDSHGHELGDEVLIRVAERLKKVLNTKAICTRFGGDEFIILLNDIESKEEVELIASSIISAFKVPFLIENNQFFLSCSLGISLYPDNAIDSSDLIKNSDTAMYVAKNSGKNQFVFYHENMDEEAHEFLHIARLIREAIQENYFAMYFQPLVNAKTHKVEGFEALIRFNHPIEGYISPEDFIPVAEITGDILTISDFVMKEACSFAKIINTMSDENYFININISPRQFQEKDFSKQFISCLLDNDVDPSHMKIELTESAVMNNIDIAITELKLLREAGVKTALDDFGTGYSSFSYLVQLPIDVIKIDKSFVIDLFKVKENRHIIEAVSTMAKAMNMHVVAEGVESQEHAEYLYEKGVDILQGFLISKALSREEIFTMLDNKNGFFAKK